MEDQVQHSGSEPDGTRIKGVIEQHSVALSRYWSLLCHPGAEPDYSRHTVLVADDEIHVGELVTHVIERALGCSVEAVRDGDEACRYLASRTVDVLIADMMMPGLHGLDLVATVHRDWPYTDVIVMTGHIEDFPYVEVIRAGGKDFIGKPFQAAELEAKVLRIFRERNLRDAQIIAEGKYRSLFELNSDGMVFVDAQSGTILDANAAFCAVTGRAAKTLANTPFSDLLDPFERGRFKEALELCAQNDQGTIGDVVLVCSDEREVCFDVSVTFISVMNQRIICLAFKDTTEKRKLEENLVETAQTDALTGLLNKRTFATNLEWTIRRADADRMALSLVFIDVDGFKQCNDTYGHQTGDEVLHLLGQIIQDNIRHAQDGAYRYGGDEFAVVLLTGTETSVRIAERIRAGFESGASFGTSLSIGVAEHRPGMTAAEFVRLADETLYKAKSLGKNTVCVA